MRLSDVIRARLAEQVAACPTCGHPRRTIAALAADLGQPATSVGRYLAGGKPSVALVDAAGAHFDSLGYRSFLPDGDGVKS